ncbi:MAG: hypothetical protein ABIH23_23645 [bacterium]
MKLLPTGKSWDSTTWRALLVFFVLAVALHFPYSLSIQNSQIDHYDWVFCSWVLAWDCHQLLGGDGSLFDANILHPLKNTLAYGTHLLGQSLWVWPFHAMGITPGGLYTIALLIAFVLNGFVPFLVVRRLFNSAAAGFVAGCMYAYAPYRYGHLTNLPMEFVFWIPALFYFLIRYAQSGRAIYATGAALCFWQQGWASNYLLVFLFYPTAIVFGWNFFRFCREQQRILWTHLPAWLVAAGFIIYTTLPYLAVKNESGLRRGIGEATNFSANLYSYLSAPPNNLLYGGMNWENRLGAAEGHLYPGFIALGLFLLSGWILFSGGSANLSNGARIGLSRRTVQFFWIASLMTALFSMGPIIHLGSDSLCKGPMYFFHMNIPGFAGLRSYARWHSVTLALSLFPAAFAFLWLQRHVFAKSLRHVIAVVMTIVTCFLTIAEGYGKPVTVRKEEQVGFSIPPVYLWLAAQPGDFAIIEYPFRQESYLERRYMYYSCYHWKILVNGENAWMPKSVETVKSIVRTPATAEAAQWFRKHDVRYLIFHWKHYGEPAMNAFEERFLATSADYVLERRFGMDAVYRVLDRAETDDTNSETIPQPIAIGDQIQGEILYPGQVDRFAFENDTGKDIWFVLDDFDPDIGGGGPFDPFLQLKDDNGVEVRSDNDSGRDDDARINTNLARGTIFVSGGPRFSFGKYRLHYLTKEPEPIDLREGKRQPDGSLHTKIHMRGGTEYDPQVFETFKFTLAIGETALVRFINFGGPMDPAFRISGPGIESTLTIRVTSPEMIDNPDRGDVGIQVYEAGTYIVEAFPERGTSGAGALELSIR